MEVYLDQAFVPKWHGKHQQDFLPFLPCIKLTVDIDMCIATFLKFCHMKINYSLSKNTMFSQIFKGKFGKHLSDSGCQNRIVKGFTLSDKVSTVSGYCRLVVRVKKNSSLPVTESMDITSSYRLFMLF